MKKFNLSSILILCLFFVGYAQMPTNGLVGYYPFNGNVDDESGNSFNGINKGATLTTDRFDNPNSAYLFNGSSSLIKLPLTTFNSTTIGTISLWLKVNSFVNSNMIFSVGDSTGTVSLNGNAYSLYVGKTSGNATQSQKFIHSVDKRLCIDGEGEYKWFSDQSFSFDNNWYHIVVISDGTTTKYYRNGVEVTTMYSEPTTEPDGEWIDDLCSNTNYFWIGKSKRVSETIFFNGKIDDIRIYNRVLNQTEINLLYLEGQCTDTTVNDTTDYYVSNQEFEQYSPTYQLLKIDSLNTNIGSCDSIVYRYGKFIYEPTFCSVTDTLIIDVTLTSISEPNNVNTIKVYPNPAKDFVIINTGDYNTMNDYTIRIENTLGQMVFETISNQQEFQIDVNTFGGYGTYIIKIIDNTSNVIETRKLILN